MLHNLLLSFLQALFLAAFGGSTCLETVRAILKKVASNQVRGLKTQGDIGQGLTPCDMDLAMFCSFYNQLVHEITYDSSHAIKGI
jgi:hypothetical protein